LYLCCLLREIHSFERKPSLLSSSRCRKNPTEEYSFLREKIHKKVHKNGRSRKDLREETKLVTLLSSSNMSSISNKNFIHHNEKDIQKYLNLVEAKNVREKMKKLYLCCLKQMNDLPENLPS